MDKAKITNRKRLAKCSDEELAYIFKNSFEHCSAKCLMYKYCDKYPAKTACYLVFQDWLSDTEGWKSPKSL